MEDNIKENIDSVPPSVTSWSIKPPLWLNGVAWVMGQSTLPPPPRYIDVKTTESGPKFAFTADRK